MDTYQVTYTININIQAYNLQDLSSKHIATLVLMQKYQ